MARPKVRLYLDVVSPFAFIAFRVLRYSPVFQDCDVTYVPVFLGGIMHNTGNLMPGEIKNKGAYYEVERRRLAKLFDVEQRETMPPNYPPVMLQTMRAVTAMYTVFPEKLVETFDVLYHAYFAEHRQIHTLELLMPLFEEIVGKNGAAEVFKRVASEEVKQLLLANTDEVLSQNGFGIPWFEATSSDGQTEYFFGVDHLNMLACHLGLDTPKSHKAWRAML